MQTRSCNSCGQLAVDPGARFCGGCGATTRPAVRLTPETIRRWSNGSDYYPRAFARMFPSGDVTFKPSWNWAAALVPFWMMYRGLVREALACLALVFVIGYAAPGLGVVVWLAQGLFGNALYFMALERRARREAEA